MLLVLAEEEKMLSVNKSFHNIFTVNFKSTFNSSVFFVFFFFKNSSKDAHYPSHYSKVTNKQLQRWGGRKKYFVSSNS